MSSTQTKEKLHLVWTPDARRAKELNLQHISTLCEDEIPFPYPLASCREMSRGNEAVKIAVSSYVEVLPVNPICPICWTIYLMD